MHILIYLAGAVVFFAMIMASVALHEVGHLIPGKLFGVKTTQYMVGFGRTLWSTRRGETEYGVKAIPLGGYCRFVGMYPPDPKSGKVRQARTGIFQSIADQAREAEWEDIKPEDDGRLFYQKKTWQKLIIMIGGPGMNIILAFLILLGVSLAYGMPKTTLQVAVVNDCVISAARQTSGDLTCRPSDPPTPAKQAGLRVGDVITTFNGQQVGSWDQLSELIRTNRDGVARIGVQRDGRTVALKPVHTVINGVQSPTDPSKVIEAGFLGVSPRSELVKGGPVAVLGQMWSMTEQSFHAIIRFPVKVYNTAANLVTGKPRDENGPMSIVGASRIAGEVSATDKIDVPTKAAQMFLLLGSVNLFLALFNFVPLMPLDGGHIAGALYEGIRRWLARVLGRPDPGHADTAKMLPVAYVVGAVIAVSGVVLILADLIDPITLF
ncbi:M50 family metallopeptidase [Microlunatus soli]|uniref:Membrane-associated protease RseP, regulator of RpoE activity n=1 Tax=Microlunatus soli TaxID=630515 RepID=A0A1H1NT93_9ACTN|nr:site-2 protease family protein [Microlunatus soli]SDS02201.1 Membrane-associated protease RseP, regulator of RpoE activity [Microlunatus soli]